MHVEGVVTEAHLLHLQVGVARKQEGYNCCSGGEQAGACVKMRVSGKSAVAGMAKTAAGGRSAQNEPRTKLTQFSFSISMNVCSMALGKSFQLAGKSEVWRVSVRK